MKFYQTLLAAGLATLLSVSPAFGRHKKESTNYPTRTECNKILGINSGLIEYGKYNQNYYCISKANLKRLSDLAMQDKCTLKGPEFMSDYDAKIIKALEGADTEDPKYIVTPRETLNYETAFPNIQKECVKPLEKEVLTAPQKDQGLEVSASAPAPVAGSTLTASKEAKTIPEGMVGIGGYIATPKTAKRLYVLTGVRAGKVNLDIDKENKLCTPNVKSYDPSTSEDLKKLEQLLIEADTNPNKEISDEEGVAEQLKMCCKQDPESPSCKK